MQSLIPAMLNYSYESTDTGRRPYTYSGILSRVPALVITLLIMLFLKRHYSFAIAAELNWILAPTVRLVAWLTSANPVWEPGVGYVDFSNGMIVAPACAGVNFMIMAFGLAAFCGLMRIRRIAAQAAWLSLALGGAYGLVLLVNSIRIGLSMVLYQADIYGDWLTVGRVHRLAGVGIYVTVLWLYFLCLRQIITYYCRCFDHNCSQGGINHPVWLIVAWYLLVAVGVPLVNRAWNQDAAAFGEHCVTVVSAALTLGIAFMVMGRLLHIPFHRIPYRLAAWCTKGYRRTCR